MLTKDTLAELLMDCEGSRLSYADARNAAEVVLSAFGRAYVHDYITVQRLLESYAPAPAPLRLADGELEPEG